MPGVFYTINHAGVTKPHDRCPRPSSACCHKTDASVDTELAEAEYKVAYDAIDAALDPSKGDLRARGLSFLSRS